ncbi:muconolactone Delta-isomerase [Aerolutibacter ruishenii]|uniref:Muconolactone Delta-isomerase n=1 Tax=Aerolutibacter ruishenii TaxID=686800 RepID=A0A562LVG2_9GAMM|nr:muconolactone Delta-isomerase [Lysobacter ruishenii]TWI11637.1 muconolactone delta-isomerase [Lysobacter ruishenii]
MLFHVRMDVRIPHDVPAETAARLKAEEKARFQELQRSGKWRHIWRVVGEYANYSIFDVDSNAELHDLLLSLPLFPYMQIQVQALCRHPSSLHDDDR